MSLSEYDPNAWGNHPYDNRSVGDVIYDYAVIRGDLSEQYARDQLANWIERLVRQRQAEVLTEVAEQIDAQRIDGSGLLVIDMGENSGLGIAASIVRAAIPPP